MSAPTFQLVIVDSLSSLQKKRDTFSVTPFHLWILCKWKRQIGELVFLYYYKRRQLAQIKTTDV